MAIEVQLAIAAAVGAVVKVLFDWLTSRPKTAAEVGDLRSQDWDRLLKHYDAMSDDMLVRMQAVEQNNRELRDRIRHMEQEARESHETHQQLVAQLDDAHAIISNQAQEIVQLNSVVTRQAEQIVVLGTRLDACMEQIE